MPVRRDTFVDASLLDAYESTTELLHGHIEAFFERNMCEEEFVIP